MGSAMETFCCQNKESNPQITNNETINSNNDNLPYNDIFNKKNFNHNKEKILDDYDILEKLGQGENSEAFVIKNKKNKNIFVLKKIKRNKSMDIDEQSINEQIESLKKLNHPYINKIYQHSISDDFIFLIEDFCSEGNLLDKLGKIQILPEFVAKIIMFQIFKKLSYLTFKNIVHGNLKLENILLELNHVNNEDKVNKKKYKIEKDQYLKDIDNDIKIINKSLGNKHGNYKIDITSLDNLKQFNKKINETQKRVESSQLSTGLRFTGMKNKEEKLKAIPNLKYTGSNNIYNSGKFATLKFGIKINDFSCSNIFNRKRTDIKNILYYSPEKILNDNNNEMSDIWECGIILFYLLSGSFPFSGSVESEIKQKISLGKLFFDFDKFNGVSEDAKDLIKKCLKIDPNRRISIIDALNHPFFDDLKDSNIYLEDEKIILQNLKNQKERPIFYQMVLTFISYNFNDTHLLHELSRIFYKIDKNTDGKITKEDLSNAYEEAEEKISKKELEEIINMVDFDKNGFIEYQEFIRVCIPEQRLFTTENLKNAFDLFDTEKKGVITYMQVVEALEREDKINAKMIGLLKNEVSNNMGNESLDFENFKNLMEKLSLQ